MVEITTSVHQLKLFWLLMRGDLRIRERVAGYKKPVVENEFVWPMSKAGLENDFLLSAANCEQNSLYSKDDSIMDITLAS